MQESVTTIKGNIRRTAQFFDATESAAGVAALVEAEQGLASGKYSRILISIVPGESVVIFEEPITEVSDGH